MQAPVPLLDTSIFDDMTPKQLRKIEEDLLALRKLRNKQYILPKQKQHFAPLKEKYIKPLKQQYLEPINKVLSQLRKHLPKKTLRYWSFDGKIYGPMSRKEVMQMICPMDDTDMDDDEDSLSTTG